MFVKITARKLSIRKKTLFQRCEKMSMGSIFPCCFLARPLKADMFLFNNLFSMEIEFHLRIKKLGTWITIKKDCTLSTSSILTDIAAVAACYKMVFGPPPEF